MASKKATSGATAPMPGPSRPSAPHSAVPVTPAAVSRIPATPHPAAVPRAPKLGAAMARVVPTAISKPASGAAAAAKRALIATPMTAPVATPAASPAAATPAVSPVASSPQAIPSPKVETQSQQSLSARPTPPPAKSELRTPPPAPATPAAPPTAPAPAHFKLPPAVYSPQLLESVVYDIQVYLDWIRQNQIRKQVGAKPKDEPNHSDETVLVIEAWLAGQPATLDAIEALLDYLHNLKLPEIHIMLAALPNRAQRLTLVDWFRNNASPELLVSFVADRNLGGGIVVRTPNRVFDFSWKQELIAGRSKLAEILKRV